MTWLILAGAMSLWMQNGQTEVWSSRPRRVFTADEFRQHLEFMRQERQMRDLFNSDKLSPDEMKSIVEFAQRIAEKQQSSEPKQPLPIPKNLLDNDKIQSFMQDEDFLSWIARQPTWQNLAERLASRYQFPDTPQGTRPLIPPRQAGWGRAGSPWDQPGGNNGPNRKGAGDGKGPSKDLVSWWTEQRDPSDTRGAGIPHGQRPGSPGNGPGPTDDASQPEGPAPSLAEVAQGLQGLDGRDVMRGLTEALRSSGSFEESSALNRVEDMMGKPPRPPEDFVANRAQGSGANWFEANVLDRWSQSPWIQDVPISPKDLTLPAEWMTWIPEDGFQVPSLPSPDVSVAIPNLPAIPRFELSVDGLTRGPGMAPVIVGIVVLVVTFALGHAIFGGSISEWNPADPTKSMKLRRPGEPFDPGKRASIREWFEYLASRHLGGRAFRYSHREIADAFQRLDDLGEPARRLSLLYAEARYLPPGEEPHSENGPAVEGDVERLTHAARSGR